MNTQQLRELRDRLREPHTLSQYAGPHDMASALMLERHHVAEGLDALLAQPSVEDAALGNPCIDYMRQVAKDALRLTGTGEGT